MKTKFPGFEEVTDGLAMAALQETDTEFRLDIRVPEEWTLKTVAKVVSCFAALERIHIKDDTQFHSFLQAAGFKFYQEKGATFLSFTRQRKDVKFSRMKCSWLGYRGAFWKLFKRGIEHFQVRAA